MLADDLESKCKLEPSILDLSIGDIAIKVEPLNKNSKIMDAFLRFMKDEKIGLIPVVDNNVVIGQIQRNRFLERTVLGRFGYGIHLNAKKCIFEVMEEPTFIIDYDVTLEDASMIIKKREMKNIYDDIIVSKYNEYHGVVPISVLLEAITQRSLIIARDSNPLTGLPGNWAIQREIDRKIRCKCEFDVCYIDINHFKPFNDCYGFEKGDKVITSLGNILKDIAKTSNDVFIGHIGGDDFILLSKPGVSMTICQKIVSAFEELLPFFHGEDFIKGYYISKNRKEEQEVFKLLSLTCAIVSTETRNITSFAHLASIASEVKSEAKKLSRVTNKSIIFRDRRIDRKDE
ncbi:MAG: GGDEF domain-containing protein [Thermodesulfovibrio sp.]|nr:GGDEF domain-containing protein [Thermodesulfovibrio sp.]MDW7998174.1 GGDEF domain-containing protein [Thermodesulfovibrio sp.]